MQLATTVLIGVLNVLFLLGGLASTGPQVLSRPGIETFVAFLVVTTPFAAVSLFAFGRRTKPIWLIGVLMNTLTVIAMLGMVLFLPQGAGRGELATGMAIAGLFSAINLAYLVWRTPAPSTKAPSPETATSSTPE